MKQIWLNAGMEGKGMLGALGLFVLNLFLISPVVGVIAMGVWGVAVSSHLSRVELLGESVWQRLLFGWMGVVGAYIILLDLFYLGTGWLYSGVPVFLLVGISTALLFLPVKATRARFVFHPKESFLFAFVSLFACVFLLVLLVMARTDASVISPWNLFSGEPFVLMFIALLGAMLTARERTDDLVVLVWMLVTFSALSVSAFVYAVGFGFDPFLHRAAEEVMASTGTISPVRILYSGQYVLISALHHLSALSVKWLDVWLVPVFGAVFLPTACSMGFEKGWGLSRTQAQTWWIGIFLIPFMLATFTVPFTITYVVFLGIMVLYPLLARLSWIPFIAVFVGVVSTVFIHPLLSVPIVLFLCGERLRQRGSMSFRVFVSFVSVFLLALSVPAMLAIQGFQEGLRVDARLLLDRSDAFVNLFRSPYWDPYPFIPWHLTFLYDLRYWLPMILCVVALVACMTLVSLRRLLWSHLIFSFGLLLAILGASTMFTFKGIIAHEQGEFALRLLQVIYTFALPVCVVVFARALRKRFEMPMLMIVCLLVTIAWYFSYPQFNLKYPFLSPSVGADDVLTVQAIDKASGGEPYLVLSQQMTSAAAIQEFGFIHSYPYEGENILWYAIPTGGPLYRFYTQTMYEGPSRESYGELARKTGVQHVFFVTQDYWSWSPILVTQLEEEADRLLRIDHVTIYDFQFYGEYTNNDENEERF